MSPVALGADVRTAVSERLRAWFSDRETAAERYGPEYARLWRLAAAHALDGKMLRPALLVRGAEVLGADDGVGRDVVLELAAAIELLHFSFLLHDDVIDGDTVRRGAPNLIAALRDSAASGRDDDAALHWGRTGAILMGDLLLAAAHQAVARIDVPHAIRLRLLDLLEHSVAETVAGEQLDVALSDGVVRPDLGLILKTTTLKTATYTFELPLRAAAILAGAAPRTEAALAGAARRLGLAFQPQDDLLAIFGDAALHGKDPLSDLREGKETALIAYARMTSAWLSIETRFRRADLTEADAAEVRRRLRDCGAERFTRALAAEQLSAARELVTTAADAGALPQPARRLLLAIAERIEGRAS